MPEQNHAGNRRSEKEQARLHDSIRELFEKKIVFNDFLGLKLNPDAPGKASVVFDMRHELIGHYQYGRLHGGVISSVLDVVGGLGVMYAIADHHADESAMQIMHRFMPLATIDMRVDFIRQGIGEHFLATSRVKRLGNRIATTESVLVNEQGSEIASASAAYMVS